MNSGCHSTASAKQRRQRCSNTKKERPTQSTHCTPLGSNHEVMLSGACVESFCCTHVLWRTWQRSHLVRKLTRKNEIEEHGTSTNHTVVTSRYSTVYYQTSPTKSDGVSESVHCSQKHALGDNKSIMCPPVLARRCCQKSLHPIWNGERVSPANDVKSNGSVTTTQPIAKLTKYPGHQHNIRYKLNNRPLSQQPHVAGV